MLSTANKHSLTPSLLILLQYSSRRTRDSYSRQSLRKVDSEFDIDDLMAERIASLEQEIKVLQQNIKIHLGLKTRDGWLRLTGHGAWGLTK